MRPINTILERFIVDSYREGIPPKKIAKDFKIGIWTVYRAIKRFKANKIDCA